MTTKRTTWKGRPVVEHRLKCWPEAFEALWRCDKRAEFRKNDRNYQDGDKLIVLEWEPKTETFTGREKWFWITHIQTGFGIPDGYVMMSLL